MEEITFIKNLNAFWGRLAMFLRLFFPVNAVFALSTRSAMLVESSLLVPTFSSCENILR